VGLGGGERGGDRANWGRRTRGPRHLQRPRAHGRRDALIGDRLEAEFFATDYANLIAWIDMGQPDPGVANGFAMGALRSADGAFILGRMADHTANAGRLYFPCGTPDLSDVTDVGEVDLASSLVREIEEETGLSADELAVEPGWTIVREAGLIALCGLSGCG
jgi:8-oxo-dGTP pyrophosphatase MutT (NUDIX family)